MSLSSILEAEQEALKSLKDELEDRTQLASEMYDLIGQAFAHVPGRPLAQVPLAEQACLTLMARVSKRPSVCLESRHELPIPCRL